MLGPFKVAQILDASTLVIVNEKGVAESYGISSLDEGVDVLVVAIGAEVPGTGTHLVIPKCELTVTQVTRGYAIAKTPPREITENVALTMPAFLGGVSLPQTVERTRHLPTRMAVDESDLRGNPASVPVKPGDTVVQKRELAEFVAWLAAANEKKRT